MEQQIEMEREAIVVGGGGGAVNSVNGKVGDVVLTTSDLENTSDYQTGTEVESAISTAIAGIDIPTKTSDLTNDGATGTSTYVEATALSAETTARENADNGLQGQIDALSASSDVTDIVGTKAELNAYDTSKLKDNDIIKVLQDESENDETTYYRWSTTTQSFTLIGEEGPYYTKAATDILLQGKQDTLTAGTNITIDSSNVISATDTTYTAGTGLDLTGTQFSIDNTVALKTDIPTVNDATLTITQNGTSVGTFTANDADDTTIALTDTTYSAFTGTDGTSAGTAGLVPAPATTDAGKFLKADGTWDTAGGSSVTVVQTTGTSTTDVMSQNAVTSMVFADPATKQKIKIGDGTSETEGTEGIEIGHYAGATGTQSVAIGRQVTAYGTGSVGLGNNANAYGNYGVAIGVAATAQLGTESTIAIGNNAQANNRGSVALGAYSSTNAIGQVNIGTTQTVLGYNSSNYRLLTGLYDGQSAHDAATVGQITPTTDSSAPTTSTAGRLGEIRIDTTDNSAYMCVDTTGGSYSWKKITA